MFDLTSRNRLDGANPELIRRLTLLQEGFAAIGGVMVVPEYGGYRTFDQQATLVAWRDQAVASGQPFYAVAPAGTSKHETGEAGDGKITTVPPGMTEAQAYKWLADYAQTQCGLVAGYYFHGGPPNRGSDPFHFELPGGTISDPGPLPADIPVSQIPPWRTGVDEGGDGPPPEDFGPEWGTGDAGGANPGALVVALAVLGLSAVVAYRRLV